MNIWKLSLDIRKRLLGLHGIIIGAGGVVGMNSEKIDYNWWGKSLALILLERAKGNAFRRLQKS